MEIQVLGNSGSRAPGHYTTSLLINGTLLVDAGTVALTLPLEEQLAIDDVLVTHAHLDHIADLPFLVDNVLTLRQQPLRVWAPEPVLTTIHRHFFNDEIYPDFTRLPTPAEPAIALNPLPEAGPCEVGGVQVRWAKTHHTVFCAGYCIADAGGAVLFSGDTTSTEELWKMARACPELKLAVVETSFPNRLEELARISGHLTPAMLREELRKLDRDEVPIMISHIKPQFQQEVLQELAELNDARLQVLQGGEAFRF